MQACKVVIVLGAPTPPGRFNAALEWLMDAGRIEFPDADFEMISLRDLGAFMVDGRPMEQYSEEIQAAVRTVSEASAVVFASPVFRASYTGLIKDFLDLLPVDSLFGKPVAIVGMGASKEHYLALENQFRPVLAWFGALVLPVAGYLRSDHFVSGELTDEGKLEIAPALKYLVQLASVAPEGGTLPLAVRAMQPKVAASG